MKPIWKDNVTELTGSTAYSIVADGKVLFKGRCDKQPNGFAEIVSNKSCQYYLHQEYPAADGVIRNVNACKTFRFEDAYGNEIDSEDFIYDWSYEDTVFSHNILSRPINGHMDSRMRLMMSFFNESGAIAEVIQGSNVPFSIEFDTEFPLYIPLTGGEYVIHYTATTENFDVTYSGGFFTAEKSGGTIVINCDSTSEDIIREGSFCISYYDMDFIQRTDCYSIIQSKEVPYLTLAEDGFEMCGSGTYGPDGNRILYRLSFSGVTNQRGITMDVPAWAVASGVTYSAMTGSASAVTFTVGVRPFSAYTPNYREDEVVLKANGSELASYTIREYAFVTPEYTSSSASRGEWGKSVVKVYPQSQVSTEVVYEGTVAEALRIRDLASTLKSGTYLLNRVVCSDGEITVSGGTIQTSGGYIPEGGSAYTLDIYTTAETRNIFYSNIPSGAKYFEDVWGTQAGTGTLSSQQEIGWDTISGATMYHNRNTYTYTKELHRFKSSDGGKLHNPANVVITLPDSVTDISHLFYNSPMNFHPVVSSAATIIDHAFSGCTNLNEVKIPASTVSMRSAYAYCTSIPYAYVPDGVVQMNEAFSHSSITGASIPLSVATIESTFTDAPITQLTARMTKEEFETLYFSSLSWYRSSIDGVFGNYGASSGCTITCTDGTLDSGTLKDRRKIMEQRLTRVSV